MKQLDRPKRKINAPKRFGCNDKHELHKNKTCSICDLELLDNIKFVELDNKIYCHLCYTNIIEKNKPKPKLKLKFVIMKQDLEKQLLEKAAPKPSTKKQLLEKAAPKL